MPNFRNSLRLKLSSVIILSTVISTMFGSLLAFHSIYLSLLPIPILTSALGIIFLNLLLSPVQKLLDGSKLFAKGEFAHRIDIKTGDELEAVAVEFNQMAASLNKDFQGLSNQKDQISTELSKLETIISTISDGIIVLDIHRRVILSNRAGEGLTNYTIKEMSGKEIGSLVKIKTKAGLEILPKDYCPINLDPNINLTNYNNPDLLYLTGNASHTVPVKITGAPILPGIGSNMGCVLIIRDGAREKELEAIQLDFVSMASHELRTPLTSVIGYLSVFMDENKTKMDNKQQDFLNRILISARQLGALIENLLAVSKVERGAITIAAVPLDWKATVTKLVEDAQFIAAQKNIKLSLEILNPNLPKIQADTVRISEVLNNLLSNAINYTSEGGKVTVRVRSEGSDVITSVTDTGIGIPEEAIPNLFTKFFRVTGAMDQASNSKGTGLGLYLAKSIIDLHHGKIWVESKVGQGSTFYFSLPSLTENIPNFISPKGTLPSLDKAAPAI